MRHFVPFVFGLLAIAILMRVDIFFTIVYFLAGIFVLSHLWMQRASQNLDVTRRFEDHAFTGEEVVVEVIVRNRGLLPIPWVQVTESVPVALMSTPFKEEVMTLGSRADHHFRYLLTARRRGYYELGPLRAESGDLLGVDQRTTTWNESRRLTIYPRVVPMQELGLPTHSALVALPARSPLFEDPSRIAGVRSYRTGDSPRRIHWPATARTGQVLVKQYQPAIARETLIFLDLDSDHYSRQHVLETTELAIVAAASIASHVIVQEHLPAGLLTEAFDPVSETRRRIVLPPRAERSHLSGILETLARVQTVEGGALSTRLRAAALDMNWGTTVAVITGRITEELADTALSLRRRGQAIAIILVRPEYETEPDDSISVISGIPIHSIRRERHLESVG